MSNFETGKGLLRYVVILFDIFGMIKVPHQCRILPLPFHPHRLVAMASSVELEAPLEAQPAALVWVELKEVKFYLEVEFGAAGFAAADCR